MNGTVVMDPHTLELLEFDKVRELLAGYAASSLGKELARQLEPSTNPEAIRADLTLVSEMVDSLGLGHARAPRVLLERRLALELLELRERRLTALIGGLHVRGALGELTLQLGFLIVVGLLRVGELAAQVFLERQAQRVYQTLVKRTA